MARLDVKQGATCTFTMRWVGVSLLPYDVYLQVRSDYASTAAQAAEDAIFSVSLVDGVTDHDAVAYGAAIDGIVDSVSVSLHADKTVLLENADGDLRNPQYRADAFLVSRTDPTRIRECPVSFDVYVTPRVTVPESV